MKLDKEQMLKQHFWILLGLLMPLLFITLVLVWTSVAAEVEQKRSDLEKVKKDIEGRIRVKEIHNERWHAAQQKVKDALEAQKKKAWENAWKTQADILVWPEGLLAKFPALKEKDFGQPLEDLPAALRDNYINRDEPFGYKTQIEELVKIVEPVDAKGEGVVQYNGGWQSVIHHVPAWVEGVTSLPSFEDLWLAQEDILVQRGLLEAIRQANDYTGVLEKLPSAGAADPTKKEVASFKNGRWRLDLVITRDEIQWKLTNVGNRQQLLGHQFRVKLNGSNLPINLWIDGKPLAPQRSVSGVLPHKTLVFNGIEGVEQTLNWRSAPVKRIDRIDLILHSQRTAYQGFKAGPFADRTNPLARPAGPGGVPPGGVPPGGMPPMGQPPGPGVPPPEMAQEGPGGPRIRNQTSTGLEKMRYVEANDQVRRRAVALTLIVDQSRIQDVLTALANSKLRMQITQTSWNRYRGAIQPIIEDKPVAVGAEGGAQPPRPMPELGQPTSPTSTGSEASSNLVELTVYGLISLYQHYPPRAKMAGNQAGPNVDQRGPGRDRRRRR